MYTYLNIYVNIYVHIFKYICTYMYIYLNICTYMNVATYMEIYLEVYNAYNYIKIHAIICKCMQIFFWYGRYITHTHTHIYIYTMYYIYHTMYFLYSVNSCYLDAEVLMFHGHLGWCKMMRTELWGSIWTSLEWLLTREIIPIRSFPVCEIW